MARIAIVTFLLLLVPAASAEVIQRDGARVGIDAQLQPKALPRQGEKPVRLQLGLTVGAEPGAELPRLRAIELRLDRSVRLRPDAFPRCRVGQIQPSTSAGALATCGDALVGEGRFAAEILLPEQAPFPSRGKVLAFNGVYRGRPAILAHVYGTRPAPNAYTLPFRISAGAGGNVLRASLPKATVQTGFVRQLRMTIGATHRRGGERVGYVSARCPATPGSGSALYPLARASLEFAGSAAMRGKLMRGCSVARSGG